MPKMSDDPWSVGAITAPRPVGWTWTNPKLRLLTASRRSANLPARFEQVIVGWIFIDPLHARSGNCQVQMPASRTSSGTLMGEYLPVVQKQQEQIEAQPLCCGKRYLLASHDRHVVIDELLTRPVPKRLPMVGPRRTPPRLKVRRSRRVKHQGKKRR